MNDQQLTAVGGEANFNTPAERREDRRLRASSSSSSGCPRARSTSPLGASYNKTEIKDPNLGVAPGGAAGLTVLDPEHLAGDPGVVSIDGNSLPNAPEWVFNATLRGALPAGQQRRGLPYTDWAYRSEVSFFLYESVEFTEDGLVEGGLRIGYATYDRGWEFAGFRPQHHRHPVPDRRHRLQQPDRLRERAPHLRRGDPVGPSSSTASTPTERARDP